jgi:hypothetical protein
MEGTLPLSQTPEQSPKNYSGIFFMGLTRLHGAIRVERSGSVKGVEDGQNRQALLA